ncbi:hypothetical protein Tco_1122703 [Tanacetum coccineum]|uniref:Uncharacterized protein n=1 Tax=Tanacetum coccineum TaxID=301880 RepID=A0ABQ5J485_9ASTR
MLAPSDGGLIIYQAYGNLYPMTGGELILPVGGELILPVGGELILPLGGELIMPSGGELILPSGGELILPSGGELILPLGVPVIYMHQFWATVTKYKTSYQFKIDNKKFSVNFEVFRDILNICPRIQGQEFDEPLTEEESLSFILELGHSGEIKYINDVIVDHLHQPWRTFALIINKCLCGKVSGLDKIQLSRI